MIKFEICSALVSSKLLPGKSNIVFRLTNCVDRISVYYYTNQLHIVFNIYITMKYLTFSSQI